MTQNSNVTNKAPDPALAAIAATPQPKRLSLFDRLLSRSQLFSSQVTLLARMAQVILDLQARNLQLSEQLTIHERSIIDLYDRYNNVALHVQASQRAGALDLRLPDVKDNSGEKPN